MKKNIALILILLFSASCIGIKTPDYQLKRIESYKEFTDYKEKNMFKVLPEKAYSLDECLNLALDNNLDIFAMKLEQAVSDEKAMAHLLTALPSLQTSYNHSIRNNEAGATSKGIDDGLESLRASKSSDKEIGSFRLEMALSSLDFGLAYINKHFENNQKKKKELLRKKAERELKFQVVQAFYSVAAAQYVLEQANSEIIKNKETLAKVENLFEKQHISRFDLLRFKKKFLDTCRQLREYERSHENYCLSLTALLGLYPDRNIQLDLSCFVRNQNTDRFQLNYQPPAYEVLEKNALHLREELIEMDIESHISLLKEKSELLKIFPNVRLFAAYNKSSNSFLYNSNWSEAGFNVLGDFLKIPSHLKNMSAEEKQRTVIKYKQFSAMVNIIAQLRIASANIEEVKERLSLKEDIYKIVQEESELTREAVKKGSRNQLDAIEKDIDLVMAHIQRTAAFANYNVALHRLLSISVYSDENLRKLPSSNKDIVNSHD